jgi:hypothetical protein
MDLVCGDWKQNGGVGAKTCPSFSIQVNVVVNAYFRMYPLIHPFLKKHLDGHPRSKMTVHDSFLQLLVGRTTKSDVP